MNISRDTALEIMGLDENFSDSDLKKAYRRLAKIMHPDTGGDKKLFELLELCKNVITCGEESNKESQKSDFKKPSTSPQKENVYITLETLDNDYPHYIKYHERKYNIVEIHMSLLIYIRPKFRKSLEKCIIVKSYVPYWEFDQNLGVVKFNHTITIPEELQKFKKFKVRAEFLNKSYNFSASPGDIKVIQHSQYNYVKCLKSICELHFKK